MNFKKLLKIKDHSNVMMVLAIFLPLVLTLIVVLSGSIPFWYDPARDLLLALKNLQKPTLIGPPSGIPGLFYGPYWIWLLSIGTYISKDPRHIVLLVQTLPYFILFPLILFKFSNLFGKTIIISLWLFFIFTFNEYSTQLWNPHLTPLLLLVLIYIIVFTKYTKSTITNYVKVIFGGLIAGLIVNFHISLGLAILIGVFLFLLIEFIVDILKNKSAWKYLIFNRSLIIILFTLGAGFTFLPFLTFEYRHGFHQVQTVINTLSTPWAVVGEIGLNKEGIIHEFFRTVGKLLHIPEDISFLVGIGVFIATFSILKNNRLRLKDPELKLVLLVSSISFSVLFLYLTSKNPVREYHFIGIEIIFLLLLAFLASKLIFLRKTLIMWVIFLIILDTMNFLKGMSIDKRLISSLATKEYIVQTISADAASKPYSVFVYDRSIYTYDYTYLFAWIAKKDVPYDPSRLPAGSNLVYLVIPNVPESIKKDFIQYRTSNKIYQTSQTWKIPDGTTIIKREKVTDTK